MSNSTTRRYLSPLRILYFIIGLGILALLLRQIDFANLAAQVLRARPEYLLLGGAAYLCKSMVRAYRFQRVQTGEKPPYLHMLRLTLASSLASQLLPFKLGELAYVYLVRREFKSSLTQGVSSLMIVRVLDLLAIPVLFLLSALVFGLPVNFSSYLSYILAFVAALVLVLLAGAALIRFFPQVLERWLRAAVFERVRLLGKLRDTLLRVASDLSAYRGQSPLMLGGLALVEWIFNFAMFHALLISIGLAPHAFDTVASVTFAALASVLPVNSFGNFGTQEAGWATGLLLLGYARETAITSGFATHLLSIGYMLVLGGISWISYLPGKKTAADSSGAESHQRVSERGKIRSSK